MEQSPHIPIDNVIPFAGSEQTEDYVTELRAKIGAWQPPTNEKWADLANPILVTTRVAHIIIMRLSRAETQGAVAGMRRSGIMDDTMYQLAWAGDWYQKMADICFAAEVRLQEHGAPPPNVPWREPEEVCT